MDLSSPLEKKLLDKSIEAFTLAIEVYNKPSIRYRVEGFSFFICNAWELMLKAHLVKKYGPDAIYYSDNPNRTITLDNCVRRILTNEHSPMHKNLMRIIELRNTSTHLIVEEYEMVYIPLFQACIFNFTEKMNELHGFDMTTIIPQNFLTLTVSMHGLNPEEIRAKYPGQIAEKLLTTSKTLGEEIEQNNHGYAIRIEHHHYITKDKNKATDIVHIEKDAPAGIQIVKELKDPNDSFKYTAKKCIREINSRLAKGKIVLLSPTGEPCEFNKYHFDLFVKYFGIKEDKKLCYTYKVHASPTYSYSQQAIEFILEEIKKDPGNIIRGLKERMKKS